jgi:hypothetical protein
MYLMMNTQSVGRVLLISWILRQMLLGILIVASVNVLVTIAAVPLVLAIRTNNDNIKDGNIYSIANFSSNNDINNNASQHIFQYKIVEITAPQNGTWLRDAVRINSDQTRINMNGSAAYLLSPIEARNPEPVNASSLSWYFDGQFIGTGLSQSVLIDSSCSGPLEEHQIILAALFPDGIEKSTSVKILTGAVC